MAVPVATPPVPTRLKPLGSVVVVLGVLAVAFVVMSLATPRPGTAPERQRPAVPPPVHVPTASHDVVYELIGTHGARNVTYAAEGTSLAQQEETGTSWTKAFTRVGPAGRTEFYSVSAQNAGPGSLSCRIVVDGVVLAEHAVSGEGRQVSCAA